MEDVVIPRFYASRRPVDRLLAWALMILHCFMAIFIVYTSYQQGQAEQAREETVIARDRADQQRAEMNAKLADQNRLILCFATDNNAFNLALADALLTTHPQPEQVEEYKRLAEIRDRLKANAKLATTNPPSCEY